MSYHLAHKNGKITFKLELGDKGFQENIDFGGRLHTLLDWYWHPFQQFTKPPTKSSERIVICKVYSCRLPLDEPNRNQESHEPKPIRTVIVDDALVEA